MVAGTCLLLSILGGDLLVALDSRFTSTGSGPFSKEVHAAQITDNAEPAQDDSEVPLQSIIQNKMETLRTQGELMIGDAGIAARLVLPVFYEGREYRPAWLAPDFRAGLQQAIADSELDGLDPQDYHQAGIAAAAGLGDPAGKAELDILCTDAILRLAYHLSYGKVDPERLDPNWNIYGETLDLAGIINWLQDVQASGDLTQALAQIRLTPPIYRNLMAALEVYRDLQRQGGWPTIPAGPTLKPDMTDPRVALLRERLAITGDLKTAASADVTQATGQDLYDQEIAGAVERFQQRHGLDPDGFCGRQTLAALNVPVTARIDQIRVNLERLRWVLQGEIRDFVLVNIAEYRVFYSREGSDLWHSRAQVGKQYRQTPVFRADLKYLVFNPTWTVPPTILREDILPQARQDPSYLTKRNISVIDRNGQVVPPDQVDWQRYTGNNFPYTLRQEPGPQNALGRVKFIFPNEHFVFLHDTPSRELFDRSQRAFSSGCIRVAEPLVLAELLLNDPDQWNQEKITQVIASERTRTVHLKVPVPVLLLYWTAFAYDENGVQFRQDIYGRDTAVLQDLDSDFQVRARHLQDGPGN
jgi:murein L,D-transpeptidase YcbB/YkuD